MVLCSLRFRAQRHEGASSFNHWQAQELCLYDCPRFLAEGGPLNSPLTGLGRSSVLPCSEGPVCVDNALQRG